MAPINSEKNKQQNQRSLNMLPIWNSIIYFFKLINKIQSQV